MRIFKAIHAIFILQFLSLYYRLCDLLSYSIEKKNIQITFIGLKFTNWKFFKNSLSVWILTLSNILVYHLKCFILNNDSFKVQLLLSLDQYQLQLIVINVLVFWFFKILFFYTEIIDTAFELSVPDTDSFFHFIFSSRLRFLRRR